MQERLPACRDVVEQGLRQNVARRQRAAFDIGNQVLTVPVDELCAVASHGFRCQWHRIAADIHCGWMKLYELELAQYRSCTGS